MNVRVVNMKNVVFLTFRCYADILILQNVNVQKSHPNISRVYLAVNNFFSDKSLIFINFFFLEKIVYIVKMDFKILRAINYNPV